MAHAAEAVGRHPAEQHAGCHVAAGGEAPRHDRVEAHAVADALAEPLVPLRRHALGHRYRGDPPRLRADHVHLCGLAVRDGVLEQQLRNLRGLPATSGARDEGHRVFLDRTQDVLGDGRHWELLPLPHRLVVLPAGVLCLLVRGEAEGGLHFPLHKLVCLTRTGPVDVLPDPGAYPPRRGLPGDLPKLVRVPAPTACVKVHLDVLVGGKLALARVDAELRQDRVQPLLDLGRHLHHAGREPLFHGLRLRLERRQLPRLAQLHAEPQRELVGGILLL
mmetsp:Transcript_27849/g.86712  ORF Transcript_27849/g.86712 Transcript_27849/m.86712 type:complete len:276 (+) Transcript_27849:1984-2811(+)